MKTQPAKAKVVAKATPAPTKAVATATAKPKAKTAAKAPVAKSVRQPAAKALPKAAPKPTPRVAPKAPVKTAKPASKAGAAAAPVKAAKGTKSVMPTTKVQPKDSVKTTSVKATKPEIVAPKTMTPVPMATPVKPVPAAPISINAAPARAGRPSSRLAQLTVPSMAQSVASTAAKASFSQSLPAPHLVLPLASVMKKDPALVNNWKLKPIEALTDAELIAMPDDEYMNNTQMAYFRWKLSNLKKEILSNAGETTEHLREDTVVVPDPADRATIEEEHALELRTRDRERKLLKKIEQSIVRIDSGDYGYCDETGEPIGVGRLLARPTANLSLEAQQRRELKQKMFGD